MYTHNIFIFWRDFAQHGIHCSTAHRLTPPPAPPLPPSPSLANTPCPFFGSWMNSKRCRRREWCAMIQVFFLAESGFFFVSERVVRYDGRWGLFFCRREWCTRMKGGVFCRFFGRREWCAVIQVVQSVNKNKIIFRCAKFL